MPKAEERWELPEVFKSENWPEDWRPTRTEFGRLQFPCPVEGWTGSITTKWNISAVDFLKFYKLALESPEVSEEESDEHYAAIAWKTRYHLIASVNLKRIDGKEVETKSITEEPDTLPDMRLLVWATTITQEILIQATNLPNLPRPSRTTLRL